MLIFLTFIVPLLPGGYCHSATIIYLMRVDIVYRSLRKVCLDNVVTAGTTSAIPRSGSPTVQPPLCAT